MAEVFDIDLTLLARAVRDGGHRSRDDALNAALAQYVAGIDRRRRFEAIAGTIEFRDGYPRKEKSLPPAYDGDDGSD